MQKKFLYILMLLMMSVATKTMLANHFLPHSHIYYQYTHNIYQHLTEQSGNFSKELPKLEVWSLQSSMAMYHHKQNLLVVDSSIIGLCRRMEKGEAALAFLLGHELVHFYKGHGHQKAAFAASRVGYRSHHHHETEADQHGAFLAYAAGYNIMENTQSGQNVVAAFLDKAYQHYGLGEELPGYLPLASRKKAAQKVLEKTAMTIEVYEAAKRFSALEMNLQAQACYQYIVDTLNIKTKTLLNNLAITKLQIAKALTSTEQQPYCFPTLLNVKDKLLYAQRGQGGSIFEPVDKLIPAVLEHYREIVRYDPKYYPASLGYAYALLLSNIHDIDVKEQDPIGKAQQILTLAATQVPSAEKGYFELAQGVLAAHQQQTSKAKQHFQSASSFSKDAAVLAMAQYNNNKLHNFKARGHHSSRMTASKDAIGSFTPLSLQNKLIDSGWKQFVSQEYALMKKGKHRFKLGKRQEKDFNVWVFEMQYQNYSGAKTSHFHILSTQSALYKTTTGIRVGSSFQALKKAYASEELTLKASSNGLVVLIPNLKLYFLLNEKKIITEWGLDAS